MTLNPFKKKVPRTEEEQIEDHLVFKYNLTKDTEVPNRFWINHEKFIDFIPGDKDSREAAEKAIQEYYRRPQLMDANEEQRRTRPSKQNKKKSGFGRIIENAEKSGLMKGFEEVGNNFMHNAPKVGDDFSNVGNQAMRDGVKNAQSLGMRQPNVDDGLAGINPRMDLDTILGTSPKPKPAVKKNE